MQAGHRRRALLWRPGVSRLRRARRGVRQIVQALRARLAGARDDRGAKRIKHRRRVRGLRRRFQGL